MDSQRERDRGQRGERENQMRLSTLLHEHELADDFICCDRPADFEWQRCSHVPIDHHGEAEQRLASPLSIVDIDVRTKEIAYLNVSS